LFEGASMSKSVFATMVMMYVQEGKLDLDKPLYRSFLLYTTKKPTAHSLPQRAVDGHVRKLILIGRKKNVILEAKGTLHHLWTSRHELIMRFLFKELFNLGNGILL
jgi:hypothetical protein